MSTVGTVFFIAALIAFRQHKDNPIQVPIGTPIVFLIIGLLILLSEILPIG